MESLKQAEEFFKKDYKEYRPNLSIDCAIFGYIENELKVLLLKNRFVKKWCLPGGYIKKIESLSDAASRISAERTGLENLFLKQFKTFGTLGRNSAGEAFDDKAFTDIIGLHIDKDSWLIGETVSIGYYAITDIVNAQLKPDFFSEQCEWFAIKDIPSLAFDHNEIVADALKSMRIDLYHFPIGKNLLQPKFTLKEIKKLYEVLLGKTLNPTNFPNKLISLNLLIKLDEKRSIGGHRSPTFYKLNNQIYDKALNEGVVLA